MTERLHVPLVPAQRVGLCGSAEGGREPGRTLASKSWRSASSFSSPLEAAERGSPSYCPSVGNSPELWESPLLLPPWRRGKNVKMETTARACVRVCVLGFLRSASGHSRVHPGSDHRAALVMTICPTAAPTSVRSAPPPPDGPETPDRVSPRPPIRVDVRVSVYLPCVSVTVLTNGGVMMED